jgi:hypothetical protein
MKRYERHLTERDRKILEFVARYRIGTGELLGKQCFQPGTTLENINRVLKRLERRGLIRRIISPNQYSYCTPRRRTLEYLGQEPRTPRPLTEQTLPVVLAVASYCVAKGLRRLTSKEFKDLYPELWRPGMRSSAYVLVDIDGKLRLELLLVDRGGAAHRINSRVRRVIAQRKGLPKFQALMHAGRFRITVLTSTQEQADKIERRVSRRLFWPIEVTTFVTPELAGLLMLRRSHDSDLSRPS